MAEPRHIGKYEIIDEIGRGGFAVVYKARDTELDRTIALKVLHPHWSNDPAFAARFRREARAAANLRHSSIVTVHDAGEADGQLYIAMEYLPGRTLREVLEAEGALSTTPLSLERALPILEQIADALDYAHGQGVVHRDVKPANVMVEETERGVRATLMDFGLVKAMESSAALTSQGTLLGSPEYMAPEQADPDRAAEVGPATDRYALGIVAYQMLTGRVPFAGNTPSTLVAHLQKAPPDPQSIRESLPVNVSQVLLKMLNKSTGDRYPSATAFVAELRNALTESQMRRLRRGLLPKTKPESKPRKPVPIWVWILVRVLVLGVACGGLAASIAYNLAFGQKPTAARVLAPSTPVARATPTPTLARAPTPGETRTRSTDGMAMVYVPGGDLMMGSADDDPVAQSDEKPRHNVYLSAFWVDRTEVTNTQYKRCVQAGACKASTYADKPNLNGENQPVTGVNWNDAAAYCRWAGAALPTEAQWEKAAKGDGYRVYPWGDQSATCDLAVMKDDKGNGCGKGDAPWPAGSKPKGLSLYGALDMAGNVSEWVADWYGAYPTEHQVNPAGPAIGTRKVLRGGSWVNTWPNVRIAARETDTPDNHADNIGFRCVAVP